MYEMPFRIKMYFVAKSTYAKRKRSMSQKDIERIEKYRNIHRGERCFIVLTGPSLNKEDLSLIKNEICFTVNSGYKAYGIGGWTPQYYVTMDGNEVAQEMLSDILEGDYSFDGIFTDMNNPINDDRLIKLPTDGSLIFRMNSILNKLFSNLWTTGIISTDISQVIYCGKTVLCSVLQIAVYMGFAEIFLLGADFTYTGSRTHSELAYEEIKGKNWNKRKTEEEMRTQITDYAKDANKKNIKICNVTRGGNLECFERRTLEEVIEYKH